MISLIHFILEAVVLPVVDLFALYNGNVVRWIAGGVFYFTGVIFAILAAVFFSMGIWPLGVIAGVVAIIFLILDCKNILERRDRRKGNLPAPVDEKALEEEQLREKVDAYRNSLNKQF